MATEDPVTSPVKRIAGLEQENERLREQVQVLQEERRKAAQTVKGAGGLVTRVLLGRRLRTSFRDWLKAKSLHDPLPADETADVLAAIFRRVVRVGMVGLIAAALPGVLLLCQTVLIREQNAATQLQIKQQAAQIEQQAADTLIVRRAQLLATIYEEECDDFAQGSNPAETDTSESGKTGDICWPRAHKRARQEAVLAYCEIERGLGNRANLFEADLRRTNFFKADLSKADLIAADLIGTDLRQSNLRKTRLFFTDLSGADLSGADLSGAALLGANLSRVRLNGASINGADLRRTRNLTQAQINDAAGDENTQLSGGLERPEHWTEPVRKSWTPEEGVRIRPVPRQNYVRP